jgi:hypothetical protein
MALGFFITQGSLQRVTRLRDQQEKKSAQVS